MFCRLFIYVGALVVPVVFTLWSEGNRSTGNGGCGSMDARQREMGADGFGQREMGAVELWN